MKRILLFAALLLLLPLSLAAAQEENTAEAITGDIIRTVYGSGSAQPVSQPGAYAKTDGTVVSTHAEMGDSVKKGDVLVVLENSALETEIIELAMALSDAQDAVLDVETYEAVKERQLYWDNGRARMDVDTGEPLTATYSNELMIRAPANGRVKAIYIEEGDDALAAYREHGAVALLSTDGKMKVELDGVAVGLLSLNQTLHIAGEGIDTTGKVISLTRRGTQAHIEIVGDEYPMGIEVIVSTLEGETVGSGTLEINKPLGVSAYGGTISSVVAKVGQEVKRYDRIARFAIGDKPLYIDNASILHDYAVALTALETARKKSDNLTIVAPCDGKVVSMDVSPGDEITDGTLAATILEESAGMQIILSVDELDIPLVREGQRVNMTVDALSGVTLSGEVKKIAPIGNTETAVTTYDVYILADEIDERVMGGMNVSGEIEVGRAEDAVLIPTDALKKDEEGYFVTLSSGDVRRVETGIMTVELTQVISGLSAGERVAY